VTDKETKRVDKEESVTDKMQKKELTKTAIFEKNGGI
jgi:hypothetical protein